MSGTPHLTVAFIDENQVDPASFEGTPWGPKTATEYAEEHARALAISAGPATDVLAPAPRTPCD